MSLEIILVAVALGMDSFSLSIGLGCQEIETKRQWIFVLLVGLFHIAMPLFGFYIGRVTGQAFGDFAVYLGAAVLFFLGAKMLWEVFKGKKRKGCVLQGWLILALPLSVSIDAFSVGFGLGTFGVNSFTTAIFFGLTAGFLTWIGLVLGDRAGLWIKNTEFFAGVIFIGLAITALI